jgi:Ca-activated chloride channel homolog
MTSVIQAAETVFEYPAFLGLAIALPVVVVLLLVRRAHDRRARLARLGTPATVARLLTGPPDEPLRTRLALLGGAALAAGLAVAGPRWGTSLTAVQTSGADVVVAIDASLSMLAPDERPNRLERAKQEVRRLRDLSPGDRTALLAFAGRSYILTPLTADDGAIDLFLDNLDPSVVGEPGTSLAHAIRQGTDLLLATPSASDRAIVVMSDGEAFEDAVAVRGEAARAAANGVTLVTVGFGTEAGSTIPLPSATPGAPPPLKRDLEGQVVITRYTPAMLAAAAEAAHGTFIPAEATDKAARIHRALATLRTTRRALEEGESRTRRFELFLIPAVLLLLLDTLLVEWPARRRAPRPEGARASVAPAGAALIAITLALPPLAPRAAPPVAQTTAARPGGTGPGAADSVAGLSGYRDAVLHGDRSPRALYNYGTALLAADSIEGAVAALTTVTTTHDAELRYRALFNLGLAHLRRGLATRRAEGDASQSDLDAALDAYKRVLLARPFDRDAVWNYELALRRKHASSGGGGGGGGGGGAAAPSSTAQGHNPSTSPAPTPQSAGALDPRQAQELLNSAAREERDVAAQSQKQNAAEEPPQGKDW